MNRDMGVSINRGPPNRPKYTMILTIGTTKIGPLVLGNSHIFLIMPIFYRLKDDCIQSFQLAPSRRLGSSACSWPLLGPPQAFGVCGPVLLGGPGYLSGLLLRNLN